MKWVRILSNSAIQKDDFITAVKAEGRKYCIVKNNGNFYAT